MCCSNVAHVCLTSGAGLCRRQVNEIDQTRQFLPNVATGEFVTGPDHRKWATLPANFVRAAALQFPSSFLFGAMILGTG